MDAALRAIVVQAISDTTEARLAALEMQRAQDHMVINAPGDIIMGVKGEVHQRSSALQALTETGLELRRNVSAARSELAAGLSGASDAAQTAAMTQIAVAVEAKFMQLDTLTAELATCIQTLGVREQMVEQVVGQVAAGGAHASMQMDAKISRVAALARTVDGGGA